MAHVRRFIAVRSLLAFNGFLPDNPRAASAAVGGAGGVYDRCFIGVKHLAE
jgi:hypothetical protein